MPTPTTTARPAATRLLAKRAFAMKSAERSFLRKLASTTPTAEADERARVLEECNERARKAAFLEKYRHPS